MADPAIERLRRAAVQAVGAIRHGAIWDGFNGPTGVTKDEALDFGLGLADLVLELISADRLQAHTNGYRCMCGHWSIDHHDDGPATDPRSAYACARCDCRDLREDDRLQAHTAVKVSEALEDELAEALARIDELEAQAHTAPERIDLDKVDGDIFDALHEAMLDVVAELEVAEASLVPLCQHSTDANQTERHLLFGIRSALGAARKGLDPVPELDARRAAHTPEPETHPEHAWVWVDGNYCDAVVIHREWAAYQRAAMRQDEESQR